MYNFIKKIRLFFKKIRRSPIETLIIDTIIDLEWIEKLTTDKRKKIRCKRIIAELKNWQKNFKKNI